MDIIKVKEEAFAPNNSKGEKIINNIKEIIAKYQEVSALLIQKSQNIYENPLLPNAIDRNQEIFNKLMEKLISHPETFMKMHIDYSNKLVELICNSVERFKGGDIAPLYSPEDKDKRFKDSAWKESIFFDFVKQMYIMSSSWWQNNIKNFDLSHSDSKYLEFVSKQIIDALSPTNFAAYNPIVIKEMLDSDYSNIASGLDNLLNDLKHSQDLLSVKTTNSEVFRLGENIASTAGKVLAENDLMQLISYEPKDKTYSVPLLISPPWINKYYILDLTKESSFIKWLVDNNYQVFLISWVNPNESHASKSFENYMQEGVIFALDYITKRFKYERVNALGYCLGGTLLASTLAYLATKGDNRIGSATFLTTLLDFTDTGDFSLFTDEATINAMEKAMEAKGYFDSKYLSITFNLLRANDMIWSFVVNNYLLGKQPMPIDLLYWNADSTNLPAAMHSFYLKNMYLKNLLKEPGGISLLGQPIDLSKVKTPSFFLSTKEDHIAPWKTTYKGAGLFSGPVEFCLAASGHVAGVINPPVKAKYSYQINSIYSREIDIWQRDAKEISGSWWVYWEKWLNKYSGSLKKSINYKNIKNHIELAPGSYVKVRYKD
jgi:polyhydroxyalkanoate synthase